MTKILLVEDDKSLREIYGVRLLAEGYDIVSAGDGEQALAMAIKERPDLILSDVMMPKISGFDMLDILRSTTETKDIRVIMMTALSSEDQRQRGEQLGADRYLVKSQVGIEDVVRTVHEVLQDMPSSNPSQPTVPARPLPPQQPQQSQQQPAAQTPQQPNNPQIANQQSAPNPQPTQQQESNLPQPTAPFSTNRPASLGERVIQPLDRSGIEEVDYGKLISQELETNSQPVNPAQQFQNINQQNASNTPQQAAFQQPTPPQVASAEPQPFTPPNPVHEASRDQEAELAKILAEAQKNKPENQTQEVNQMPSDEDFMRQIENLSVENSQPEIIQPTQVNQNQATAQPQQFNPVNLSVPPTPSVPPAPNFTNPTAQQGQNQQNQGQFGQQINQ